MTAPIIRLEPEALWQSVSIAVDKRLANVDADIKSAIESALSDDSISRVVRETVVRETEHAIKEEITRFFRNEEPGRQVIRDAVLAHFKQDKAVIL